MCKSCRSRKMLFKNQYLHAKIGFDTEENEPSEVWSCSLKIPNFTASSLSTKTRTPTGGRWRRSRCSRSCPLEISPRRGRSRAATGTPTGGLRRGPGLRFQIWSSAISLFPAFDFDFPFPHTLRFPFSPEKILHFSAKFRDFQQFSVISGNSGKIP